MVQIFPESQGDAEDFVVVPVKAPLAEMDEQVRVLEVACPLLRDASKRIVL